MNPLLDTALRYVMSGAVGYALGSITMYRRARIMGVSIIVPTMPRTSRTFTALVLVLSLVTAFTVISGQLEARHARQCDEAFRSALTAQARINTEDRDLEREDDRLRSIRDNAIDDLVRGIAALPPEAGSQIGELIARYDGIVDEETRQRQVLNGKRAELQRAREANPYPTVTCD